MKQHRRRLFVDPSFQGRLLLRLVMYWAVYHIALWHLMFLFTMVDSVLNHDPTAPATSCGTLYREFAANHISIIVCFFVMLPILGRDLLKFSHRLAGPLVRFRNTMQQMIDGKPVDEVTLRRFDLPSEFLAVFNDMVRKWNERVADSPAPAARADERELELVEAK